MKSTILSLAVVMSLSTGFAHATRVLELSGENESLNIQNQLIETKIDQKKITYSGACYAGYEVINSGWGSITKQKYYSCSATMHVPTCNIPGQKLLQTQVSYDAVCGTPLLAATGGYYYPKTCRETMTVKYCERKVVVNQDIAINVVNFTGVKSSLGVDARSLNGLSPVNTFFALTKKSLKRTDIDLFNANESIQHEVVIMDANAVSDFKFSDINIKGNDFNMEFSPELNKYAPYFKFNIKVEREKVVGNSFKVVASETRTVPAFDGFLSFEFKAKEGQKRDHRVSVELVNNDYEILSSNPNYRSMNTRVKKFVPAKN